MKLTVKWTLLALLTIMPGVADAQKPPSPKADLEKYVRPTVKAPIPDGVSLSLPSELGNKKLALLGLVDVTAPPFNADPTGRKDSTQAIQRAVNFARDAQMATFFPEGTYLVSDTIQCAQGYYLRSNGRLANDRLGPCVLIGSRKGKRPRIVLRPHSPGFDDPSRPKRVIDFWSRSLEAGPETNQANISMNQMFVNIDIVIGEGNPGAIAIHHEAAQGSAIQDCTIDVTHGLVGIEGGAGSGGSHANITVIGGRYGLDLRKSRPAPTITAVTLVGQKESAILYANIATLTAVGLKIVVPRAASGPAIKISSPSWSPYSGQICLIDSEIVFESDSPNNVAIETNRSVYMKNVYFRNAGRIVNFSDGTQLKGPGKGWYHVQEYAHSIQPPVARWKGNRYQYTVPIYLNGVKIGQSTISHCAAGESPPADLQSRHVWGKDFPTWESPGAVNVKSPPYNAKGDGVTDDTDAIQRAVNESEIVFLPKGYYRVTRTITLRPETKLVGIARHLSTLIAGGGPHSNFDDPNNPKPIVRTANSRDGSTLLAFCGIFAPREIPGAYALLWQVGGESIYRAVNISRRWERGFTRRRDYSVPQPGNHPLVVISGNGGGRWYNFFNEGTHGSGEPAYRHLLVTGTHQALQFYQCNTEHARAEANMEIRNAANVNIYGLKSEGNYPILWIRDSDNINLFGFGGNASAFEHDRTYPPGFARYIPSLFRIERTPNFRLVNLMGHGPATSTSEKFFAGRGVAPDKWHMVLEVSPRGREILTSPLERPLLYQRGFSTPDQGAR